MLLVATAQSSSDSNEICYMNLFPVLWTTLYFHIMGHMKTCYFALRSITCLCVVFVCKSLFLLFWTAHVAKSAVASIPHFLLNPWEGCRVLWLCPSSVCLSSEQHQHPFSGPLSGTIWVSCYQKGKTNLDLLEQETVSGSGPHANLHLAQDR